MSKTLFQSHFFDFRSFVPNINNKWQKKKQQKYI